HEALVGWFSPVSCGACAQDRDRRRKHAARKLRCESPSAQRAKRGGVCRRAALLGQLGAAVAAARRRSRPAVFRYRSGPVRRRIARAAVAAVHVEGRGGAGDRSHRPPGRGGPFDRAFLWPPPPPPPLPPPPPPP